MYTFKLYHLLESINSNKENTIDLHIPESDALKKFNSFYRNNKVHSPIDTGDYLDLQAKSHNQTVEGTPLHRIPEEYENLLTGHHIHIENSSKNNLRDYHDKIDKNINKHLSLQDLKDIFEVTHPYEVHSFKFPIQDENHENTKSILTIDPSQKDDKYKELGVQPEIKRGVLFNRINGIFPLLYPNNEGLRINTSVFHQRIDDEGKPADEPELVGFMHRTISPQKGENVIKHDYLDLPEEFRNKRFANAALAQSFPQYVNKLNANHVSLYAGSENGVQTWGKMGGVLDATDPSEITNNHNRTNEFRDYLYNHLLNSKSSKESFKIATDIVNQLKEEQIKELIAHGMNEEKAQEKVNEQGLEPYKIANFKLKDDKGVYPVGYHYLAKHEMPMFIPLTKKSKHGHSFPLVAHRFPELIKTEKNESKEIKNILIEAVGKKTIDIFVNNSPAMQNFKKNYQNSNNLPPIAGDSFATQVAKSNKARFKSNSEKHPFLTHGDYLKLERSPGHIDRILDEIKNNHNRDISLHDLKNTFETIHPYDIYKFSYQPSEATKDLTNKIKVNSMQDVLHLSDKINGDLESTQRGVLFSRLNSINAMQDPSGHHIELAGNVHFAKIHPNGEIDPDDLKNPGYAGGFVRKISFPDGYGAETKPHIYHDSFALEPGFQDKEFGSKFYNQGIHNYLNNLDLDHIKLYAASSRGGQNWARKGAVYRGSSNTNGIQNILSFRHYIKRELEDTFGKNSQHAEQVANNIWNGLKEQQINSLLKTGHTKEQALKYVNEYGVDPYLISSIKLKHDNVIHNLGYDFLNGRDYAAAIPLKADSEYARSLPIVARRFPLLQKEAAKLKARNL